MLVSVFVREKSCGHIFLLDRIQLTRISVIVHVNVIESGVAPPSYRDFDEAPEPKADDDRKRHYEYRSNQFDHDFNHNSLSRPTLELTRAERKHSIYIRESTMKRMLSRRRVE